MQSLIVCGAGDLGSRVAKLFLKQSKVTLETRSSSRHEHYKYWPVQLKLSGESSSQNFDQLLISFPPSTPHYLENVKRALGLWNKNAKAVFVSSTGVYLEDSGDWVDERSQTDKSNPLSQAEDLALAAGADVVRLAGLYSKNSGPHIYWQKSGKSQQSESGYINLIHRQDAARYIHEVFSFKKAPEIWNLSDNNPVTRGEVLRAWKAIEGEFDFSFSSVKTRDGKRVNSSKLIHQSPLTFEYESFLKFTEVLKTGAFNEDM